MHTFTSKLKIRAEQKQALCVHAYVGLLLLGLCKLQNNTEH